MVARSHFFQKWVLNPLKKRWRRATIYKISTHSESRTKPNSLGRDCRAAADCQNFAGDSRLSASASLRSRSQFEKKRCQCTHNSSHNLKVYLSSLFIITKLEVAMTLPSGLIFDLLHTGQIGSNPQETGYIVSRRDLLHFYLFL